MNSDILLAYADQYEKQCQNLIKTARIRRLPSGKWRVLSQKGKSLGTYDTKEEAVKRLRQVEYFKHHDKDDTKDKKIDLTDIDDFSYSAIMRKLNQKATASQIRDFLRLFKAHFDLAVKHEKQDPGKIALQNALIAFNKKHPIKLDKNLMKTAAIAELGNAKQVGKYLSDIVKFILNRLPVEKRQHAAEMLKQKFSNLNESEIASKNLPQTAAYGQAITFVKHVLFNQHPEYIREVLNSLAGNL